MISTKISTVQEGNNYTASRDDGQLPANSITFKGNTVSQEISPKASSTIPKSESLEPQLSKPLYKRHVKPVEAQPLLLDMIQIHEGMPERTRFFLECLCDDKINKNHLYDGMFKMLVKDIDDDAELQNSINEELGRRFPVNYQEDIRGFFQTYQSGTHVLESLSCMHAYDKRYHRFYTPLSFIKGILDNIYSGRPLIKGIEGSGLKIEYKPIKKSEWKIDWRDIDDGSDNINGRVVAVSKSMLSLPEAKVKTKEDLDKWFLMIKKSLPVKRIHDGCYQRSEFTESLMRNLG